MPWSDRSYYIIFLILKETFWSQQKITSKQNVKRSIKESENVLIPSKLGEKRGGIDEKTKNIKHKFTLKTLKTQVILSTVLWST